ncbi:MAG TPA: alpha/beta fold hydrolase [Pararhodobacter sp.]|uniref:alpha/beta fold hydrolase n=1 Tax=Pararhodobacter sp. TaxID=2127056 RepID=UPI002BC91CBC|nr:alpha/beta fold hydrolase [Pararhodobacter sp.]HPD93832.1 alpha/beta fold hydrolase [Pararhodobacter sp.]
MGVQHIRANGISLAIEDHGPRDGVPLILIRGQGSQMAHWPAALIDGFAARGFRTVIFDNRDVGLSQRCPVPGQPADADSILDRLRRGEALPAPYGIGDLAADVTGLMDALAIERAHVFGISMGGMVVQQLMLDAPDRLLSAVIVMSACRPLGAEAGADAVAALARAEALLVRPRTRAQYLDAQVEEHGKWGSPGYPMPEDAIRAMAEVAFDRGVDPEGMNRQVMALSGAPDRRPGLARTRLPTLVLHGEDDTLIPLDLGREIAATIPGAAFRALPGMGHIITPALAPLIVAMVADFVAALR